ncbi:MAG: hypothetical protein I4O49_06750 [Janthinobacterium lividum]|nr:hypothetical protein [Janthinobacterium lividum]
MAFYSNFTIRTSGLSTASVKLARLAMEPRSASNTNWTFDAIIDDRVYEGRLLLAFSQISPLRLGDNFPDYVHGSELNAKLLV